MIITAVFTTAPPSQVTRTTPPSLTDGWHQSALAVIDTDASLTGAYRCLLIMRLPTFQGFATTPLIADISATHVEREEVMARSKRPLIVLPTGPALASLT